MRSKQPQRVILDIEALDVHLTPVPGQLKEVGEVEAAVGAGLAAGLQGEPFEAGRLVIGDPKVGTLPGDRGQPVAQVSLRIQGAALVEYEADFAGGLVRPRPSAHRGTPILVSGDRQLIPALSVRAAKG
ncbi:hypothetical protein SRABI128_05596 [Microbacterium sp. Bi128]|nr:hypothetical protein SRABI128_05596 [Microbacterium sp. Bi128]